MLRNLNEIIGYTIVTPEGPVGKCKDLIFSDKGWSIQYLDIDAGSWLNERRVILSPHFFFEPDWSTKTIKTDLSKKNIEDAPPLDADAPISRKWEESYFSYFSGINSLATSFNWSALPPINKNSFKAYNEFLTTTSSKEGHLRSLEEVIKYSVKALDDEFGNVVDLIAESQDWTVKFIAITFSKWLPGKKVLVLPERVQDIDWTQSHMEVDIGKDRLESFPEYNPLDPVNKALIEQTFDYRGRPTTKDNFGGAVGYYI